MVMFSLVHFICEASLVQFTKYNLNSFTLYYVCGCQGWVWGWGGHVCSYSTYQLVLICMHLDYGHSCSLAC